MYDSSAKNFKVEFDVSSTNTADFKELKPLNIDYDGGDKIDTWNDLCSQISNSVKTAIDPTWSMSFKFAKNDPVAQFIIGKEYAVGKDATCKVKITNKLKGNTGEELTFTATIGGISYSASTDAVLEISFDLKVFDNTTFTETAVSASV